MRDQVGNDGDSFADFIEVGYGEIYLSPDIDQRHMHNAVDSVGWQVCVLLVCESEKM